MSTINFHKDSQRLGSQWRWSEIPQAYEPQRFSCQLQRFKQTPQEQENSCLIDLLIMPPLLHTPFFFFDMHHTHRKGMQTCEQN